MDELESKFRRAERTFRFRFRSTGAGFYLNATSEKYKKNYRMYDLITVELPRVLEEEKGINVVSPTSHSSPFVRSRFAESGFVLRRTEVEFRSRVILWEDMELCRST